MSIHACSLLVAATCSLLLHHRHALHRAAAAPAEERLRFFALTWFPASPFSQVDFTARIFLTVMLVTIHYLVYVIDVSSAEINAVLYSYRGLIKDARNTLQDEVTRALCCKYPLQSTHRRNSL